MTKVCCPYKTFSFFLSLAHLLPSELPNLEKKTIRMTRKTEAARYTGRGGEIGCVWCNPSPGAV